MLAYSVNISYYININETHDGELRVRQIDRNRKRKKKLSICSKISKIKTDSNNKNKVRSLKV